MSNELIALLVLVVIFVVATVLPVNMGVLGIVAAFGVGTALGVSEDDIFGGFPGDLFIILVGVTYLFAIASNNGTVDWLVQAAVRAVGGRAAAIPWVMFLVTAALTAAGAVVPGAVAIVVPIALGFAIQYGINPLLMGLMVVNGAIAGGFSPISVFGSIVNGVVERNDLAENAMLLFVSSFVFNLGLSAIVFGIFGGRHLLERRVPVEPAAAGAGSPRGGPPPVAGGSGPVAGEGAAEALAFDRDKVLTLIGILALIVVALAFDVDVGFEALSIAAVLSVISPQATKGAVDKVAWSTVLLVCGIVTYVGLLENIGSIDWLGEHVADIGAALIAAMLICYVGGVVSAFASTTGILGALIPLAVPFLKNGSVGTVGLIIALSISSSVVDASPFSTSGALTVANSPQDRREFVFRGLMRWGFGWC